MASVEIELLVHELPLLARGDIVVGIDEVGRGALAGPIVVGAVVLNSAAPPPVGLNDSKLLTPARRRALVGPLERWAAEWSLGESSAHEIDVWGLRVALAVAATRALDKLTIRPTYALIDGSTNVLWAPQALAFGVKLPPPLSYGRLAHSTIVKGDRASAAIAAASVLAKVYRDDVMVRLGDAHPHYHWAANKGYGSLEHRQALADLGPSTWHRQSWSLPPVGSSVE